MLIGESIDQSQNCTLNDELETSSESSDSGINSPKLSDIQQQDLTSCTHALFNGAQNPHSRIEKILQIFKIEPEDCNSVDDLFHILNLLSLLIREVPSINFDGLTYKEAFSFFKERGIDINSQNEYEITLLHLAIQKNNADLVKHLLTIKNVNPFIQDNNGRTPFDYAKEKTEILQILIEAEYRFDSAKNKFFHFAVQCGHIEVVKYLVEKQKFQVDLTNCQYSTPLHVAAMEGHVDIVKYLIAKGANVNHVSRIGYTALILAVGYINNNEKDHLKIIKLLTKNGADINFISQDEGALFRKSTLHFAVEHFIQNRNQDSLNIVSYLLSLPKLNVNICDDRNETVLHYVVKSKLDVNYQLKIINTLLKREDIDLLAIDNWGKTPFNYAQKPVLNILCKYTEIRSNYYERVIDINKKSLIFGCSTLLITNLVSAVLYVSSISLKETIQDSFGLYICGTIMLSVSVLVGNLICSYIEKGKIKENFERQVENLMKGDDNIKAVLTQPQTENIHPKVALKQKF